MLVEDSFLRVQGGPQAWRKSEYWKIDQVLGL
jgi:hypothetical protein